MIIGVFDEFEQELCCMANLTEQPYLSIDRIVNMSNRLIYHSDWWSSVQLNEVIKTICPYIVLPFIITMERHAEEMVNSLMVEHGLKGVVTEWRDTNDAVQYYLVASDLATASFLKLALA